MPKSPVFSPTSNCMSLKSSRSETSISMANNVPRIGSPTSKPISTTLPHARSTSSLYHSGVSRSATTGKAKTVSTLLKQRAISQTVAAATASTDGTTAAQHSLKGVATDKPKPTAIPKATSTTPNLAGMSAQEIIDVLLNKNKAELDNKTSIFVGSSNSSSSAKLELSQQQKSHTTTHHDLLMQQLKRPPEVGAETTVTTVPCKRLKTVASCYASGISLSSPGLDSSNRSPIKSESSASPSISSPVSNKAVTVGKLLQQKQQLQQRPAQATVSPQKNKVLIQNVTVATSQPTLSTSMAAYARSHSSSTVTSTVPPLSATNPIVQQVRLYGRFAP